MGKVYENVVRTVPNGAEIASTISCDYLITCGVSNWGGLALSAGLFIARSCAVHERFQRNGIGFTQAINIDNLMMTSDQVNSVLFIWFGHNKPFVWRANFRTNQTVPDSKKEKYLSSFSDISYKDLYSNMEYYPSNLESNFHLCKNYQKLHKSAIMNFWIPKFGGICFT